VSAGSTTEHDAMKSCDYHVTLRLGGGSWAGGLRIRTLYPVGPKHDTPAPVHSPLPQLSCRIVRNTVKIFSQIIVPVIMRNVGPTNVIMISKCSKINTFRENASKSSVFIPTHSIHHIINDCSHNRGVRIGGSGQNY
jgi:hypothetical protein